MKTASHYLIPLALSASLSLAGANTPSEQINHLLAKPAKLSVKPVSPRLKDLQANYRFVLFYRSTCAHCHHFIPILSDFAKTYQVPIIAYSTDGPSWGNLPTQPMSGQQYKDYFVRGGFKAVVPALFLQNKHTLQTYAVLFGEAQPYQLAHRLNDLLKKIEQREEGAHE